MKLYFTVEHFHNCIPSQRLSLSEYYIDTKPDIYINWYIRDQLKNPEKKNSNSFIRILNVEIINKKVIAIQLIEK